jgi:predicted nuclease of predicted toxin-antitoxin system
MPSVHVREVGLREAADSIVWDYAARHGLAIVTKDADFRQRSFLEGHPPKVLEVDEFLADGQKSFLGLS